MREENVEISMNGNETRERRGGPKIQYDKKSIASRGERKGRSGDMFRFNYVHRHWLYAAVDVAFVAGVLLSRGSARLTKGNEKH